MSEETTTQPTNTDKAKEKKGFPWELFLAALVGIGFWTISNMYLLKQQEHERIFLKTAEGHAQKMEELKNKGIDKNIDLVKAKTELSKLKTRLVITSVPSLNPSTTKELIIENKSGDENE